MRTPSSEMFRSCATCLIFVRSPSRMGAPSCREKNCRAACKTRGSAPSGKTTRLGCRCNFSMTVAMKRMTGRSKGTPAKLQPPIRFRVRMNVTRRRSGTRRSGASLRARREVESDISNRRPEPLLWRDAVQIGLSLTPARAERRAPPAPLPLTHPTALPTASAQSPASARPSRKSTAVPSCGAATPAPRPTPPSSCPRSNAA